jgi:putative endonuclease
MNRGKNYFVYILASKVKGILYIGVTSNLVKRVWEHKNNVVEGFTNKYKVKKLVYYITFDCAENAILREKQLKRWKRCWKIREIEKFNPLWKDLYFELI